MTEHTDEQKAAALLMLEEEVTKLIRKEIIAALQDTEFLSALDTHALYTAILMRHVSDSTFRNGVKVAMQQIMSNSYG